MELPMKLMSAWFAGGVCSSLVPLFIFLIARRVAHTRGNQQNSDNNSSNSNSNYYYSNNCAWYQWGCISNNSNNNNNDGNNDRYIPWWWFGSSEARRQRRYAAGSPSPALILTYLWSLILFGSLLYYGWYAMRNNRHNSLVAALIMFANLCFLAMVLLHGMEGAVSVNGPELERDGFYGQFGVLLYLTFFSWLLFSLVMALWVHRRASHRNVHKLEYEPDDYDTSHHSSSDYNNMQHQDDPEEVNSRSSASLYKQATV